MKHLLIILILGFCSAVYAQNDTLTSYDSLKLRTQVSIGIPDGYHEMEIPYMRKIPHNFAITNADTSCQIRFFVTPLDTWLEDFSKKSKKEQKNSMHPNALCKSMMMLAVLNASNNQSQGFQVSAFPELSKEAYNADWDASTMIETGWPQIGFKYTYIWCLHKDDVGEVYVYLLADNMEDFMEIMGDIAPMIKFN
jgi:hypothetical protein